MATKADKENTAPAVDAVDEFPLGIDEFCAALSIDDRRVELIGGFHAQEKREGRVRDLPSAYRQRYADFANAPA